MRKRIIAVIGAGFGDEGKGLMTDYFCHQFPFNEPVLNIRYNGGFQAGHTVNRAGKRHIFNGFGSGSFNDKVYTYFGPHCIFNGMSFWSEYNQLVDDKIIKKDYNKFFISKRAKITFMTDVMMGRASEKEKKHGSCGLGIFETFRRNQFDDGSLTMDDVRKGYDHFIERYNSIANKYWKPIMGEDNEYIDGDCEWNILSACAQKFIIIDEDDNNDRNKLNAFNNVVFEGAQGLMLDMNNQAYWPHLTPSNTGSENIKSIMSLFGWSAKDLEICYVTRSYKTRHGNGFLMHETDKEELGPKVDDNTNINNEYQGSLRFGYIDQSELTLAISKDIKVFGGYPKHSLAVTHLDQTDLMIKIPNENIKVGQLEALRLVKGLYISLGNTATDITKVN